MCVTIHFLFGHVTILEFAMVTCNSVKIIGLNIALVPANMTRLSFGPCKKKICFWSLQNFLFFKIVPLGTIFRNKFFCRDLFKKQNILQGPKATKWVQSSCVTYTNHHKNGVRDYFKKQKILQGPKTIFFLQGPKLKRGIFAGTSAIFKPKMY